MFRCPACRKPTLAITESVACGPDDDSGERSLQLIACPCGLVGAAEYTESRRGRLDGESWHHDGYALDPRDLDAIRAHMARREFPAPGAVTPRLSFPMKSA